MGAGLLFFPEFPQDSLAHIAGLQSLVAVTSLFADMAGNAPCLTRERHCGHGGATDYRCLIMDVGKPTKEKRKVGPGPDVLTAEDDQHSTQHRGWGCCLEPQSWKVSSRTHREDKARAVRGAGGVVGRNSREGIFCQ